MRPKRLAVPIGRFPNPTEADLSRCRTALREAICRRVAGAVGSQFKIMYVIGHVTMPQAQRSCESVRRKRLSGSGFQRVIEADRYQKRTHHVDHCVVSGGQDFKQLDCI